MSKALKLHSLAKELGTDGGLASYTHINLRSDFWSEQGFAIGDLLRKEY